jgi:four helix bundle protein
LHYFLLEEKKEYVISRQILKSGTSIGANIRESKNAQSNLDFINKLSIALKEADETAYWLELLSESSIIDQKQFDSLYSDLNEIISLIENDVNLLFLNNRIQRVTIDQQTGYEYTFTSDTCSKDVTLQVVNDHLELANNKGLFVDWLLESFPSSKK